MELKGRDTSTPVLQHSSPANLDASAPVVVDLPI